MLQKINPSDNNRNIILASLGGISWGGKEVYNTFSQIKKSKNSYVYLMKGFYFSNEKTLEKDLRRKNITEPEIKEQISYYTKLRKENIQKLKSDCRTKVNKIKKFAPSKITLKTLGGAVIGLGTSLLINYIKDKTMKK